MNMHPPSNRFFFSRLRRPVLIAAFLSALGIASVCPESASYRFESLTINDGLSNSSVSGMVQDENGFLWFGTQAGLNRYDGYEFEILENDPFNENSLGHNQIQTMYRDDDGTIWIGTYGGLDHYDTETGMFTHYVHDPEDAGSLSDNVVVTIHRDIRGRLWAGTLNGLNRLVPETGKFIRYMPDPADPSSLPNHVVRTVLEDEEGTVWVGTYGGLSSYDESAGGFTTYRHDPSDDASLPSDFVLSLETDPDETGILWIGTWDGGLSRFDISTGRCENFSLPDERVYTLYLDSQGRLWIGTWGGGLVLFSRKDYSHEVFTTSSRYGIANNIVYSFLEDATGILWIGTNGGGINKLVDWKNRYRFFEYDPDDPHSISDGKLSRIYEDDSGTMWYGTYNTGVNRFDESTGRFYRYSHDPEDPGSLSNDIVTSFLSDSRGDLLIATNNGLNRYLPETDSFELVYSPSEGEGVPDTIVYDLMEDRNGNLWVGSYTSGLGLYHRNEDRWEYFAWNENDPGSLSNNLIRRLFQDSSGRVWVGTNHGLNLFDPETRGFRKYLYDPHDRSSISNSNVTDIFEDSSGNIWIGTNGGGVNLYHPGDDSFTFLSSNDGLLSNMVVGIEEDGEGGLWFATKQGVSVYDRAEQIFRVIDDTNGLLSNELTDIYRRPSDGSMHIGSAQGVTIMPRKAEDFGSSVPRIIISDFSVNGRPYRGNETVPWKLESAVLERGESYFSFEFTAMDYSAPERNTYAYKLEGFDRDWIYTGSRNYGSYTNIPPGRYTLRIIGAGSRNNWNRDGVSLAIKVRPPLWRTPGAFAGYVFFALVLSGFGVYRIKRHQRKTMEQLVYQESINAELEKKVQTRTSEIEKAKRLAEEATRAKSMFLANMSHEIRTPLNGITGMLALLRRSGLTEDQVRYLEYCEISVENLTHIVGDLLDLEKIQSGKLTLVREQFSLRDLVRGIIQLFTPQAQGKGLHLESTVDSEVPDSVVGDRTRVSQVLGNLLSNAVKYTDSGSIRLNLSFNGSGFVFSVADTGIGMEEKSIPGIFDQFSRLTEGPMNTVSGVGLGLAIVKQLVQGMGGTIEVASTPGGGSVFTVALPLEPAEQPDAGQSPSPADKIVSSENGKTEAALSGRVLVAEDEGINGMYIEQFLTDSGFSVTLARTGREAVELFEKESFDLILMDIGLPELNGYEASRIIREMEEKSAAGTERRVPIIALTAHAYPEDIERCYAAGMDSFVSKPIVERTLIDALKKALSG